MTGNFKWPFLPITVQGESETELVNQWYMS